MRSQTRFLNRLLEKLKTTQAYQKEAAFILVSLACVFVYIALLSFNPFDQSSYSASFPQTKNLNLGGRIGANLSAWLIFYFGIQAFFMPLLCIAVALCTLKKAKANSLKLRALGATLIFFSLLFFTTQLLPHVSFSGVRYLGSGVLGYRIGAFFKEWFGLTGSVFIFAGFFSIGSLLLVQQSIFSPVKDQLKHWSEQLCFLDVSFLKKRLTPRKLALVEEKTVSAPLVVEKIAIEKIEEPSFDDDDLECLSVAQDIKDDDEGGDDEAYEKDESYEPPPVSIFRISPNFGVLTSLQKKEFENTAKLLSVTFEDFGIKGTIVAIQPGPVVTVFEFQPDAGTKLAKINSLVDDLALALRVDSIMLHPVRGKRAVGIQVPNQEREMVRLGDIIQCQEFKDSSSPLTLALGKSIAGEPVCADLTKMPHLLTAGATGAGKSVAINSLLCSVIMKASPKQVKMILVDPKMLELSIYDGIPHLLMPVITEPERAAIALKWATQEMERRYRLMQFAQVRNILGFNEFIRSAPKSSLAPLLEAAQEDRVDELPYILIVIDELADLMMTAPKDVEAQIQRLAQKARASGIHLVLATQRPSVDIITGVIKANLPCRTAFQVVSKHDSRTILDQIGADKLLGNGDMLLQRPGNNRLERIQGAFISDEEVISLVQALKHKSKMEYDHKAIGWISEEAQKLKDDPHDGGEIGLAADDPKFDDAIAIARKEGAVSASYLQRQLKIGYNRAARIVETMEAQGLVGKAEGVKARKWLGKLP